MLPNVWPVVLAGGAGTRLNPVTGGVPKQYWTTPRGSSLLEMTLMRLAPLGAGERTTVVVDHSHQRYLDGAPRRWAVGHLLHQPTNRGTAAGILFGLTPVLTSAAADAIVIVTPSDHAIEMPAEFRASLREAVSAVAAGATRAVLFGATPDAPTADYGWIVAGPMCAWSTRFRRIERFLEKPGPDAARRLFLTRALWNTLVLVARAGELARLYDTHLPETAEVFAVCRGLPPEARKRFLASRYTDVPERDFSRDVLARAPGLTVYAWPASMGWSDLGTPARMQQWISGGAEEVAELQVS